MYIEEATVEMKSLIKGLRRILSKYLGDDRNSLNHARVYLEALAIPPGTLKEPRALRRYQVLFPNPSAVKAEIQELFAKYKWFTYGDLVEFLRLIEEVTEKSSSLDDVESMLSKMLEGRFDLHLLYDVGQPFEFKGFMTVLPFRAGDGKNYLEIQYLAGDINVKENAKSILEHLRQYYLEFNPAAVELMSRGTIERFANMMGFKAVATLYRKEL